MMVFFLITILVAMLLILWRTALGPSLFDCVLALNTFGTLTVILLAFLAVYKQQYYLADIAMLYALVNFILTFAILRLFKTKTLSSSTSHGLMRHGLMRWLNPSSTHKPQHKE